MLHLDDKRIEHMKTFLTGTLLAICLSATVARSQEDQARYETVTVTTSPVSTNASYVLTGGTNSIDIAEGEVGELNALFANTFSQVFVVKNSQELLIATYVAPPSGQKIAGPATFKIVTTLGYMLNNPAEPRASSGLMTVKKSPLTYSPQKSVTVAPGMGNVQIELESSTNLLTWAASTNGVYNDDLRFFRVKLTKLNP